VFAGFSRAFERDNRTTENRGVPGSSPGLAIRNPAFQRDFSFLEGVSWAFVWALDWAPGRFLAAIAMAWNANPGAGF
jgi:hypothetical protein